MNPSADPLDDNDSREVREATLANRLLDMETRLRRYIELHHQFSHITSTSADFVPAEDILAEFSVFTPDTILDVGANVGQSALLFRAYFSSARIHCFEPVKATFELLSNALAKDPLCECHLLALGAEIRPMTMQLHPSQSKRNAILPPDTPVSPDMLSEIVQMTTLDRYIEEHPVSGSVLLKIDAEGHDLQVLGGAEALLRGGKINFIIIEAGMNPDNTTHVPFPVLHEHLVSRGFLLLKIYEQHRAWNTNQPHLRRADLMYVRSAISLPRTQAS